MPSRAPERPRLSPRSHRKEPRAGFIEPIDFDPIRYGIPPVSVEAISTVQLYALHVAEHALADADLLGGDARQREQTSVILGVGGSGNTAFEVANRLQLPHWQRLLARYGLPEPMRTEMLDEFLSLYAPWQEATFPGCLANVVCGRIANRFDLGGANFSVDAACATSFAALHVAAQSLWDGSSDAVLTGGVNLENTAFSFLAYSKLRTLSRQGVCRPFDRRADGMVLGDACAMLVLKRLSDAERDGNRIYALLRAVGAASDGRGKSLYAPRHEGQLRALRRAYEQSGIDPSGIGLVEAHGTGTQIGDPTELHTLTEFFGRRGLAEGGIALGSVKSQIGHARVAAGAAALVKTACALAHRLLPPGLHGEEPLEALGQGPFYLNGQARPWLAEAGQPRRAGLNAFGFGGTNFHVILEEYTGAARRPPLVELPAAFFLAAPDAARLRARLADALAGPTASAPDAGASIPMAWPRLGFVYRDRDELAAKLRLALARLDGSGGARDASDGIFFRSEGLAKGPGLQAEPCRGRVGGENAGGAPGPGRGGTLHRRRRLCRCPRHRRQRPPAGGHRRRRGRGGSHGAGSGRDRRRRHAAGGGRGVPHPQGGGGVAEAAPASAGGLAEGRPLPTSALSAPAPPAEPSLPPSAPPAPPARPLVAAASPEAIVEHVVKAIEQMGFPRETIDFDANLEEPGIGSLKSCP